MSRNGFGHGFTNHNFIFEIDSWSPAIHSDFNFELRRLQRTRFINDLEPTWIKAKGHAHGPLPQTDPIHAACVAHDTEINLSRTRLMTKLENPHPFTVPYSAFF